MRGSRGRASRGRGLYHGGIWTAPHKNTFEQAINGNDWNFAELESEQLSANGHLEGARPAFADPRQLQFRENLAPEHFHAGRRIAQRGRGAKSEQGISRERQEMAEP